MLYYFKKGKTETEMQKQTNKQQKKTSVQCMEKILWLIKHVKSDLQESVLEISHWMMLHG